MRDQDFPKRAFRRQQKKRIINKIFHRKMDNSYEENSHSDEFMKRIYAEATCESSCTKSCSNCYCCGNPRRMTGRGRHSLTMQELKQDNIKDILIAEAA